MAQQIVNLGTGEGTAGADSHYVAHGKHKANVAELYDMLAALTERVADLEAAPGGGATAWTFDSTSAPTFDHT